MSTRTALSLTLAAALALGAAPALTGCATRSAATYKPGEAGQVMRVERARIVTARTVTIEGLQGDRPGWGTLIGATVAGAASYGLTGADTPLGQAVTIIAAVGGALAGTFIEEQKNRHPGAEYVLRGENGRDFAVVQTLQGAETMLPVGKEVVVLYGRDNFVRVAPDELVPATGTASPAPAPAPAPASGAGSRSY